LPAAFFKENDGGAGERVCHSPLFVMRVVGESTNRTRFGVVISQKVAKKAVTRHRLKRRIHGSLERFLPYIIEKFAVVIYTKQRARYVSKDELTSELRRCLHSTGVMKK
jgi:ribonuclease P protein component